MVDDFGTFYRNSIVHLNIKNDEAHTLASRLAGATGETLTRAVTESLRERLARIERERSVDERLERVMSLVASIRADLPEKLPTQAEMDDWFYDEHGLPR